jgi:hypothetical protein
MSTTAESLDQAPPKCRVAVAPRRADGQSEDDEVHTPSMSEAPFDATPDSYSAGVESDKGAQAPRCPAHNGRISKHELGPGVNPYF